MRNSRIRKHCHRRTQFGAITFKTSSAAVRYLLTKTHLTQANIARRCKVTPACVSQLASTGLR